MVGQALGKGEQFVQRLRETDVKKDPWVVLAGLMGWNTEGWGEYESLSRGPLDQGLTECLTASVSLLE